MNELKVHKSTFFSKVVIWTWNFYLLDIIYKYVYQIHGKIF